MAPAPRYKRVLVKISGESFCRPGELGIDAEAVAAVVDEIAPLAEMGVQTAVVVGGGNLVRGRELAEQVKLQQVTADYMGMLATVINALALRDVLDGRGLPGRVMGAISMPAVCEPFIRQRAVRHLDKARVLILAAGTGSPHFTTDTCASLRARELAAEVLLKATKVDGVYDADPMVNPSAKRYQRLSYQEVLGRRLGVMDLTAVAMCMEAKLPVVVFELLKKGNLARAVQGEAVGTVIGE